MNLGHFIDLHYNLEWFEWILKHQKTFDLICITGDFLDTSLNIPIDEQITFVSHWLNKFSTKVIVCSGNHDLDEFVDDSWLNNITNVYGNGSILRVGDFKIGSLGYFEDEYYNYDDCDILLTHVPPFKTNTSTDKNTLKDCGNRELHWAIKNKIIRPKIILSGHIHMPISNEHTIFSTQIYNASKNITDILPLII